jgi:hypothetical protein
MTDLINKIEKKLKEDSYNEFNKFLDSVTESILVRTKIQRRDSEDDKFIEMVEECFKQYMDHAVERMAEQKMRDFIGSINKFETLIKAFDEVKK